MHLQGMLGFVSILAHGIKLAGAIQLPHNFLVDKEIAKRSGILFMLTQCTARQIQSVRRAEEKDSFRIGQVQRLVGPGGGGSRVGIACVSRII